MAGRPLQFSHRLFLRRHRSILAGTSHLPVEVEAKGEQLSVQPPSANLSHGVRPILTSTRHLPRHHGHAELVIRFGTAHTIANAGNSGSTNTTPNRSAQHQRNHVQNAINHVTVVHNNNHNSSNFRRNHRNHSNGADNSSHSTSNSNNP